MLTPRVLKEDPSINQIVLTPPALPKVLGMFEGLQLLTIDNLQLLIDNR